MTKKLFMPKAIFLDRDGVIVALNRKNPEYGFLTTQEDVDILPGVPEALRALKAAGFMLVVITNQPVIARGIVSEEDVQNIHDFINVRLGGVIDRFNFCPHHPEMHPDVPAYAMKYRVSCSCRKPLPGMIFAAAKEFDINLGKSWMVGDLITDIVAGKKAGCKTIMIQSAANERRIVSSVAFDTDTVPDYNAKSLSHGTEIILSGNK